MQPAFRIQLQATRRCLDRRLRLACAAVLLGAALPCGAASPAEVFAAVVTPQFVRQEQCGLSGILRVKLRQEMGIRFDVREESTLSREQMRALATRFDEIGAGYCAAVTPLLPDDAAWAGHYEQLRASVPMDPRWDRFLADGKAVKWAALMAALRNELLALQGVIDLALSLQPDLFKPQAQRLADRVSPQGQQLMAELRKVALTDEEAKTRFMLASYAGEPAFRQAMPARFDIESLARIEAKTRRLGLLLVQQHGVDLRAAYDVTTRAQLLRKEDTDRRPQRDAAFAQAARQVNALAAQYRRP